MIIKKVFQCLACCVSGACCEIINGVRSGRCSQGTSGTCAGEYQGDGTSCDDGACPPEPGACCEVVNGELTGNCSLTQPENCAGLFRGSGTECDAFSCPPDEPPPPSCYITCESRYGCGTVSRECFLQACEGCPDEYYSGRRTVRSSIQNYRWGCVEGAPCFDPPDSPIRVYDELFQSSEVTVTPDGAGGCTQESHCVCYDRDIDEECSGHVDDTVTSDYEGVCYEGCAGPPYIPIPCPVAFPGCEGFSCSPHATCCDDTLEDTCAAKSYTHRQSTCPDEAECAPFLGSLDIRSGSQMLTGSKASVDGSGMGECEKDENGRYTEEACGCYRKGSGCTAYVFRAVGCGASSCSEDPPEDCDDPEWDNFCSQSVSYEIHLDNLDPDGCYELLIYVERWCCGDDEPTGKWEDPGSMGGSLLVPDGCAAQIKGCMVVPCESV